MAFSLIQPWAGIRTGSGTTSALVLGSVPLAGDLLVASYSCETALTATVADNIGDGVGWTVVINGVLNSNSTAHFYLAYKIVGTPSGGLKTITMTISGSPSSNFGIEAGEYAATGAISIDGTPTFAVGANSIPQSPGTITTTSATGLVIGINHNNAAFPGPGTGFTSRLGTPNALFWDSSVEDQITTVGGVYDANWAGAVGTFYVSMVIGFQQASASLRGRGWLKYLQMIGALGMVAVTSPGALALDGLVAALDGLTVGMV